MKEPAKYSCLVVDDEPIARRIIMNYIKEMPLLEPGGESINAFSAIDHLKKDNDIDIIFLDINMPNLSGFQMMKILKPNQPVIFTTAYAEYAVESYELNAADYLLKPFSFERFTKAVYRAINFITPAPKIPIEGHSEKNPVIYIKSDGKNYPVQVDDILYCEAMKNYTKVILRNGQKLLPLIPLSRIEVSLLNAGGDFIQVHRSFLISRKQITAIRSNSVSLSEFEIPLGLQYKERFFKIIGMKFNG